MEHQYPQYYPPDPCAVAGAYPTSQSMSQTDFDQLLQQASTIFDAHSAQQQPYHPIFLQPGLLTKHPDDPFGYLEGPEINAPSTFLTAGNSQSSKVTPTLGSHSRYKRSCDDLGLLAPNTMHKLTRDILPTPQAILDGSYYQALDEPQGQDVVIYLPRKPEWSGRPSVPSILFSVNGKPGPYLRDVIKGRVEIDGGYDSVFDHYGFKKTNIRIDWPGVEVDAENIPCMDEKGSPVNRAWVCQVVASRVMILITQGNRGQLRYGPQYINSVTKPWNLRHTDCRKVRLMAINYYKKVWVPVLAVDA